MVDPLPPDAAAAGGRRLLLRRTGSPLLTACLWARPTLAKKADGADVAGVLIGV